MIIWELKTFDLLTVHQLYALLQLRSEVFIVEQDCPYLDEDGKDPKSWHLMGWNEDGILVAYTRLLPAGLAFEEISIGRVVTSPLLRGKGAGRELMQKSLDELYGLFGQEPIRIGAQCYLIQFYESFGFKTEGDIYLEDGIAHIEMVKSSIA